MKARYKNMIVIGVVLVVLLAAGAGWMWYSMSQPLYRPGMVRTGQGLGAPLIPAQQAADGEPWTVEPGIVLHHFSAGTGRNVLIVHGGPGMPYLKPWTGLAPLTDRYTFQYYDQRGCGLSTHPVDKFSSSNYYENMMKLDKALGLGAQIADIERIRRILGEDKLILIGHSFGGMIAALYAAEFPEHVQGLILVAPAETLVMPPPSGGLYEEIRQRLPADQLPAYDAYLKRYFDYQNLFSQSEQSLVELNNEFVPFYLKAMPQANVPAESTQAGWGVQAIYMSMGTQHDYRPALQAVTAPVLVLQGVNDSQPEATSRMYVDALPNAQLKMIDGATHFPFEEQPAVFAKIVGDFLAGLH